MKLKDYALIGLGMGGIATIIALAAYASQPKEYVLMMTASGPGTIDIATGTHTYPIATEVTVTATPDTGYQANWNLNGVDVEQGINTYSIYVNGTVTLGVYFVPIGPPHGTIAGIRSVGSVGMTENLGYYADGDILGIDIAECDEGWNRSQCIPALMQFKVYDAGGIGIPNIPVAIYPDINPDATVFKGYTLFDTALSGAFNPTYYDANNPLYLNTDAQGLVNFRLRTFYATEARIMSEAVNVDLAPSGFGKQLCDSTSVYARRILLIIPIPENVKPISKGQGAGFGYLWYGGGGGSAVQYNRNMRAEIVGSAYYTIQQYLVTYASKWVGNPIKF